MLHLASSRRTVALRKSDPAPERHPCSPALSSQIAENCGGEKENESARTAPKLDFRGKYPGKDGFQRRLGRDEEISSKGWLEPIFARPAVDRFVRKPLEFLS
jgi:hypothetical protein